MKISLDLWIAELYPSIPRKFLEVRMRCVGAASKLTSPQLYEDDARIGHRDFDLKLTQRVKMSMVCRFLVNFRVVFIRNL